MLVLNGDNRVFCVKFHDSVLHNQGVPAFSVAATLATRDCETIHDMSQDSDEEMEDGEEVEEKSHTRFLKICRQNDKIRARMMFFR